MRSIEFLGEAAWLLHCDSEQEAARCFQTLKLQLALNPSHAPLVQDLVLAYRSLALICDPNAHHELLDRIPELLLTLPDSPATPSTAPRLHRIPVLYDGPDLPRAADLLHLSIPELVKLHSSQPYHVFAIGFQPGFPYAGYLPDPLAGLPRLAIPRTKVPPGSVAIAGRQTGIYPADSPGGWTLLGRTPLQIVSLEDAWFPIAPGDQIAFSPINPDAFHRLAGTRLPEPDLLMTDNEQNNNS